MNAPKTVAELKRMIKVGVKIEMTRYNGGTPPEKLQGVGTITRVQSNGCYINRGHGDSFFDFPKATNFAPSIEFHDRFETWTNGNYPITLEYKIWG